MPDKESERERGVGESTAKNGILLLVLYGYNKMA